MTKEIFDESDQPPSREAFSEYLEETDLEGRLPDSDLVCAIEQGEMRVDKNGIAYLADMFIAAYKLPFNAGVCAELARMEEGDPSYDLHNNGEHILRMRDYAPELRLVKEDGFVKVYVTDPKNDVEARERFERNLYGYIAENLHGQ